MEQIFMKPKTILEDGICVTDVRALPGDSAFLIDDGKTAVLYDSGFAFTCAAIIENIKMVLGSRPVDYILLTHSHYDHVLGVPQLLEEYPNAKVVASAYAAQVFERASAKAAMCKLNRKSAQQFAMQPGDPDVNKLKVDLVVNDGDQLHCGSIVFTALHLPGHTKCSVGYYLAEKKLLLSVETLGVYFGKDTYLPAFLVGYALTLASFQKVSRLAIERILLPHCGIVEREQAAEFLKKAEAAARETAQTIVQMYLCGKTKAEIYDFLAARDYKDHVRPVYPEEAFRMNTQLMIELAVKELAAEENDN